VGKKDGRTCEIRRRDVECVSRPISLSIPTEIVFDMSGWEE